MISYVEMMAQVGDRARRLRLLRNLQQRELAERAGVGLATVRRFERGGQSSLASVVRIAVALRAEAAFEHLFEPPPYQSLDEALSRDRRVERKRVRRSS